MTMTIQNETRMASRARHLAKKQGMTLHKSQKPIQAFGDELQRGWMPPDHIPTDEAEFVATVILLHELGNTADGIAAELRTRPDVVSFVLRKHRCPMVQLQLQWEDCPTQDT